MSDAAPNTQPDAAALAAKAAADLAAANAAHETALAAAVEKARKQEKDKLYGEIESAKERAKKLEEENAKIKAGAPKPEIDMDKIVASVADTVAAKYEAKLAEEAAARKALQDRLDSADLALVRSRLISENAGTIIEDMVDGKTKEELESSLAKAKAAFAKYAQRFARPEPSPAPTAPTIAIPPTPSVNTQGTPGPQAVEVSKLSLGDYKKNRQALLAAAKAQAIKDLGVQ